MEGIKHELMDETIAGFGFWIAEGLKSLGMLEYWSHGVKEGIKQKMMEYWSNE